MLDGLEKAWNSFFRLDETTPPEDEYPRNSYGETICSECLEPTHPDELELYGGICEHCDGLPNPEKEVCPDCNKPFDECVDGGCDYYKDEPQ